MVIATLRDSFHHRIRTDGTAVEVLNQAAEIHLERLWSEGELQRATQAVEENGDPRLMSALAASGEHGVAEHIAAGPQLWRELRQASRVGGNPRGAAYAWAAIDLARAGVATPVPRSTLDGLHEYYIPGGNKALLVPESLGDAWDWATEPQLGTTRHLIPTDSGWQAFDYLVDAVLREPQLREVPSQTWATALELAQDEHQRREVALAAFFNNRPDVSDRVLLPTAREGDLIAMRMLGVLHRRRDPKKAKTWLRSAIAAGDTTSMRLLGNHFMLQGTRDKAVKWYRRAAKAGDAECVAYFRQPCVYEQPVKAGRAATDSDRDEWDDDVEPWSPTPRTLKVLEAALDIACDMTYSEIEERGGKRIRARKDWSFMLGSLPSQTWMQGRRWRRELARCYDDLANDIRGGNLPVPLCTGEEMALHIALEHASAMTRDDDELVASLTEGLPEAPDDYDWAECKDLLFEDHDVLWLYWPWMSGTEDPDNPINVFAGVAYLRPAEWFRPFRDEHTRDPERGHRR